MYAYSPHAHVLSPAPASAAALPASSLAAWSQSVLAQLPSSAAHERRPRTFAAETKHAPAAVSSNQHDWQQHTSAASHSPSPFGYTQRRPSSPPTRPNDSPYRSATPVGSSAAPHAELAQQYSLLLSRYSLQTAQLEAAQASATDASKANDQQAALLTAISQAIFQLWSKVEAQSREQQLQHQQQQQQHQQTSQEDRSASRLHSLTRDKGAAPIHPLSPNAAPPQQFTESPALTFARAQARSLLSALSSGRLSASEVGPLVAALEGEISSLLHQTCVDAEQRVETAAQDAAKAAAQKVGLQSAQKLDPGRND